MADNQTHGRGQAGNIWQANPMENLTLSILYRPHFIKIQEQFLISMMSCLSVYELLKETIKEDKIEIKWPNDILINRKKVCGILIENSIQGCTLQNSIIGIGLNVKQENFYDVNNATSMILSGYQGTIEHIGARLLEILEKNYLKLKSGKSEEIHQLYLKALMGMNETLRFSDHKDTFEGQITHVNKDGQLIISTYSNTRTFYHKEIIFIDL